MSDLFRKLPSVYNYSLQAYTSTESLHSEVPRKKKNAHATHSSNYYALEYRKKQGKYFRGQDYVVRSFKQKTAVT